ncbi:MAG TPA: hypothetical protein VM012_12585 [Flavitalea sp.]|nr:hypothetical protein [Flavitalea sp.]
MADQSKNKMESDSVRSGKPAEELPGYPHYPASEDIMNQSNGLKKTPADSENLTRSGRYMNETRGDSNQQPVNPDDDYDDLGIVPGTEADVTQEDLILLGVREGDQDMGDDESIHGKIQPVGRGDEELDIPGSELDDNNEALGEEDEENNYYSVGGDRHENLEEGQE